MATRKSEGPAPLYRKLSARASQAMGPERAAAHQRGRIEGAMVAAVELGGYQKVNVGEVVAMAGVSKSVFYRHFASKEDCFLRTFEQIVELGAGGIEAAYRSADGVSARLTAATEAFLALATEQGPVARLIFIASLDVGAAASPSLEQATRRFEGMLAQSLAEAAGGRRPSPLALRGVVGGAHEVVYRRLRDGEPERLQGEIGELVAWALLYAPAESEAPSAGHRLVTEITSGEVQGGTDAGEGGGIWEESPKSRQARRELSQRERIMRGAAQVVGSEGYGALSVAAISTRAGVSNQTFYESFGSKEEAFLAAFDGLALVSFERTASAFAVREGWLRSGAAGVVALLGHFARNPLHRQLAMIEFPAAGPAAMARAEAMLEAFIGFLEPEELPAEVRERPSRVVLEAIAGGMWAIIAREIMEGRGDSLTALAPELIDFVLAAFRVELKDRDG